ncbi:MAG: bacillithiol biosynthesis cysteine-adding enzyme BshC [Vicinamibacterales bacterium]
MLSQSGLATSARLPFDVRRFPWVRRLASDYCFDFERLAPFFAGNPATPGAWAEAIARVQAHPRQRDAVADILVAQQRRRQAPPEAEAATAQLRDPRCVAIVTGQQAGLLGGPLFTLLKALTALRLAERVRAEHHVPAVAIFWIDAEDHDWDEVRQVGVFDGEFGAHAVAVGNPPGARERPVAQVQLDASIDEALAALEATLPKTDFTPELLATIRQAYRAGTGMAEAFGRFLDAVLGPRGLVVYDASDPTSKPLAADLFVREVEQGRTSQLAADAGARLDAAGYHAQVTPHAGNLALFDITEGRQGIRQDGDRFLVGETAVTRDALLARLRQRPQDFSPNVLLRPLVQDTLFPTICYVAGPNELAYLGQLRGVYDAFGMPMPLMAQRASATLVDSNALRFLTRHEFPLEGLRAQDESALNQLLEAQLPPGVEATLEDARRVIQERMEAVAGEVPQIDATLEGAARSTLGRMQDDLKKLHNKIIQAAKRKDETLRRQFKHAQAQAFPGGHPQEREIGFVSFLNQYGPGLVDRLGDEITLDMGVHWVVSI